MGDKKRRATKNVVSDEVIIREALKTLGINVPYYRAEVERNSAGETQVTFYLYGGRVEGWARLKMPSEPARAIEQPVPCEGYDNTDFTTIPGVGKVTAQKLNDRGIYTFAMLGQAWWSWLRVAMKRNLSEKTLEAIDKYLTEEKA